MQTPSAVHSHVQRHSAKLHWQTQMPFCVQLTEHRPSHNDLHRFCNVAQASSSSQTQFNLQPSLQRSILIVQRGTSTALPAGPTAGVAEAGRPVAPTVRSIMTIAISKTPTERREQRPPSTGESVPQRPLPGRLSPRRARSTDRRMCALPPVDGSEREERSVSVLRSARGFNDYSEEFGDNDFAERTRPPARSR